MSQHQFSLAPNIVEVSPDIPQRLPTFLPPPSAMSLYQQIPPTCSWNLADILRQGVRPEQNIYGYINSLLTSIFLPSRRYQVNPQYPLRPRAPSHQIDISVGSTGEIHSGRSSGREEDLLYPDFVITKPSPRGPNVSQTRINAAIAIVEVKNAEYHDNQTTRTSLAVALNQVGNYAQRLSKSVYSQKDSTSSIIPSYIIYGKHYAKVATAPIPGSPDVFRLEPLQYVWEKLDLNAGRAPLAYRLCELAVKHWNLELNYTYFMTQNSQ